jgi:DNA-binding transcriptional MerR regulator
MPTYTITELAREFDITPRAIRFYEDQGLISPKREGTGGRTRVYSARERTRLKLTLRGKRLGLTLSEIKSLVDMYESPKDSAAQMQRFLNVLAQHRETLEQQREDIEVTLAEIAAHEEDCRRLLLGGAQPKASKKGATKTGAKIATKTSARPAADRSKEAA